MLRDNGGWHRGAILPATEALSQDVLNAVYSGSFCSRPAPISILEVEDSPATDNSEQLESDLEFIDGVCMLDGTKPTEEEGVTAELREEYGLSSDEMWRWLGDALGSEVASEVLELIAGDTEEGASALEQSLQAEEAAAVSLQHEYEKFTAIESQQSGLSEKDLVRPSGLSTAKVFLKLNYATFNTSNPIDGESCDETSPCNRLLMRKVWKADNSFWFERCFRRFFKADGVPRELLHLHQPFSRWCEDYAPILVLFGRANADDFRACHSPSSYRIYTMGVAGVAWVQLELLRGEDGHLRQIVLFVPPPEYYYHSHSPDVALQADTILNLAGVLGGVVQDLDWSYFP